MITNHNWIALELKDGSDLHEQSVKIHTMFSMNDHLPEQGYTLALYQPDSGQRGGRSIAYLQTDHPEFFNNCCGSLSAAFNIRKLPAGFSLPANYSLVYGKMPVSQKAV